RHRRRLRARCARPGSGSGNNRDQCPTSHPPPAVEVRNSAAMIALHDETDRCGCQPTPTAGAPKDVCSWPSADIAQVLGDVRFLGLSGPQVDCATMSAFDPKQTKRTAQSFSPASADFLYAVLGASGRTL